jgi:RHS repeat-associated protein
VTDRYDYDAFGNVVASAGTTANVFRYQGEAFDAETGLYYLRARYYDPVAGRFLSVDPMADQGQHPYTYAGADPVNGHDPTGQETVIMYSMLTAVFTPSAAVMVGMREDIKCIFSLTGSMLGDPRFVIGRLAGCVARFWDAGDPGGAGGGGGGNDPPCKCGNKQCCKYIQDHGSDSATVASGLGLPGPDGEAEILAVSSIESGWGLGNFVVAGNRIVLPDGTPYISLGGNNFFSLHEIKGTLLPYSVGWNMITPSHSPSNDGMAVYNSYLDSAKSFADRNRAFIQNQTNPADFGLVLGKHGFGPGAAYAPAYSKSVVDRFNLIKGCMPK